MSVPSVLKAAPAAGPFGAATFVPPPQIDEYRLVRALGRGGMGQVFLGHDSLLDRPVAVKFLVTATPTDQARLRFLMEARAIARLQHPNVVAIYRVGIVSGLPYLVSEFVTGRGLDNVDKPLPWADVLRIGIDLSRGLSAVHQQGVLHRDIKPANVMLRDDGTTKLLDFGLAKLTDELTRAADFPVVSSEPAPRPSTPPLRVADERMTLSTTATGDSSSISVDTPAAVGRSLRLTADGAIIGTPAYMPPEMWLGEPATEQADIYMLGAVLYELCCGAPPHAHRVRSELRTAVLNESAPPLAERVPSMDRQLAAIIMRCLERELARRMKSAKALQAELAELAAALAKPSRPRARWQSYLLSGGLLAAGGFAVLGAQLYLDTTHLSAKPVASAPRPRVAVLGLKAQGSEAAPRLGRAFAELLAAELSAGERLLVLPAERVEHMKIELGLDDAEQHAPVALERIRKNLGPDLVVVGSIAPADARGALRLTVRVQDCQSGAITATAAAVGQPAELFALATRIGGELRARLGGAALSQNERAGLRAQRPASPEVAQLYAEGLLKLHHFEAANARRTLERVIEADPDYPLGHLALADALTALGYDERARAEVRRAFALSGSLRREERSLIEARYRETTKEWPAAFALYRALAAIHPDQIDYGLDLAAAQLRAEQPAESLRTVEELRRLPEPLRSDPRIDLAEARAHMERSNFTTALALIDHAAHNLEAVGAQLMLARTLLLDAFARMDLGQHERARNSAERSRALFSAGGDTFGAVESLLAISTIHSWSGDFARALAVGEQALRLLIEQENDTLTAVHLGNLASRLCQRGELALATARAEAGLVLGRQVGNREATGQALVILGQVALLQAELPLCEQRLAQARVELQSLGDPRMTAWVDFHLGQLRVAQGRLDEAAALHERALQVRDAQQLLGFAAESRVALGTLLQLRGRSADAEALARAALLRFTEDHSGDNRAWAQALLAQTLGTQGHSTEAAALAREAMAQLTKSQNVLLRTRALPLLAPVLAGSPAEQTALRSQLQTALLQAQKSGFVPEELELDLQLRLLPRSSRDSGPTTTAGSYCDLARRAQGLGLALIAERASHQVEAGCEAAKAAEPIVLPK